MFQFQSGLMSFLSQQADSFLQITATFLVIAINNFSLQYLTEELWDTVTCLSKYN